MNVLICSQQNECQVEKVSRIISAKGGTPVFFERYRADHWIYYKYLNGSHQLYLNIEGRKYTVNSHTFPSIWYRVKPVLKSEIPGELGSVAEKFCIEEWRHAIRALEMYVQDSMWINKVRSNYELSLKPYQLKLAIEVGLKVPNTIISNHYYYIQKLGKQSELVYKTLSSFCSSKDAIFTNSVQLEQLQKNKISIAMAPGIYQQHIKKDHELRVTVVGNTIFTVLIDSQKLPETSLDWRHMPHENIYEIGKLSNQTREKLLEFHRRANLVYAAYDFIVDRDGNEIFLECNPGGQWLWLEEKLDLNISETMAKILLKEIEL